ncbi:VOC family protein [Muricauda sp. 2012CJ35-5]|uniref:VOC family protein n=1 Tax=Flagellimonas spongiicola TaxID=2942208 RepID=A0ABT0PQK3_9FLAO|nr:VOC family protein [Allomuricauda spongiicola]MCL6273571.1 VOC family protein [Allomuricauda spongiicola]
MNEIKRQLSNVSLVVRDYDEAIKYYVGVLNFELHQDVDLGDGKRWVVVGPKNAECGLVLGKAVGARQESAIGNQTGGRVFLFLHTSDFWSDYKSMKTKGVIFKEKPREEAYGTVVVFEDLYGNLWDLLELN